MAISHIASIRGSARMTAQLQKNSATANMDAQEEYGERGGSVNDVKVCEQLEKSGDQVSNTLSSMNISSTEEESTRDMTASRASSSCHRPNQTPMVITAPPSLAVLRNVADIESLGESQLSQLEILNRLEEKWLKMVRNFNEVIRHLGDSSAEVTEASRNCLQSFRENVETTCDRVDLELKAQYQLMTKCDELTTKLSTATSFGNEIKTLRKSVETLEQLYKTKSQLDQHR